MWEMLWGRDALAEEGEYWVSEFTQTEDHFNEICENRRYDGKWPTAQMIILIITTIQSFSQLRYADISFKNVDESTKRLR